MLNNVNQGITDKEITDMTQESMSYVGDYLSALNTTIEKLFSMLSKLSFKGF